MRGYCGRHSGRCSLAMKWPSIELLRRHVTPPSGFSFDQLSRKQVPIITKLVKTWYPTISVGMESVHLRENFFYRDTYLAKEEERDIFPLVFEYESAIVGLLTLTRIPESLVLTGRLGAFDPNVRGLGIGNFFGPLTTAMSELMNAEAMYFFATLQHPITQKVFEKMGMQIVGIVPGYDRDQLSDGSIKRVPEAIYAKVLSAKAQIYKPNPKGMT